MNYRIELHVGKAVLLMLAVSHSNCIPNMPLGSPWLRSVSGQRNDAEVAQKIAAWKPEHKDHAWERSGFFEGDIVLPRTRNAVNTENLLWPGGVVPYVFDTSTLDSKDIFEVLLAMVEISRVSCVKFRPKTQNDRSYLVITAAQSGCFSHIGHQGGPQVLNLQKGGCFYRGAPAHELMHALGFFHEHSVYGRDNFIDIKWENVDPGHFRDFISLKPSEFTNLGIPYDVNSIMHYSSYVFSKNGKPTIIIKATNHTMDVRTRLSPYDAIKLQRLYKCPVPTPWIHFTEFLGVQTPK